MSYKTGPRIVTDGIILAYDAADTNSYAPNDELVTDANLLTQGDGNFRTAFRDSSSATNISIGPIVNGSKYQLLWNVTERRGTVSATMRIGFAPISESTNANVLGFRKHVFTSNATGTLVFYPDAAGCDFDVDFASLRIYKDTVTDITGDNDCSLKNKTAYNTYDSGYFILDGGNDYIENSSPNIGISGNLSATLSCWFNDARSTTSTTQALFAYGNGPTAGDTIAIILQDLGFSAAYNGGNNTYSNTGIYSLNTWNNVAITKTPGAANTTTRLYLNGVEQTIASSSSITPNVTSRVIRIGRWTNEGQSLLFQGNVSSCQIYDRALTSAQILQNYNATKGRYGL